MRARWWWLLLLLWFSGAWAEVAVPALTQRVTDLTGTLDSAQNAALTQKLADFEKQKGAQIAILLVPTTQPETIEQYSIRVVDTWMLGRKGVDDGVLLLVAKKDRKLRIEVGRGLEGALNDATAKRIIAEVMTPSFKQGDFAGGINAGVESIIKVINGEAFPLPSPSAQPITTNSAAFPPPLPSAQPITINRIISSLDPTGEIGMWVILGGCILLVFGIVMLAKNSEGGSRNSRDWDSGGGYDSGSSSFSFDRDSSSDSSSDSFSGGGGGFSGGGSSGSW